MKLTELSFIEWLFLGNFDINYKKQKLDERFY